MTSSLNIISFVHVRLQESPEAGFYAICLFIYEKYHFKAIANLDGISDWLSCHEFITCSQSQYFFILFSYYLPIHTIPISHMCILCCTAFNYFTRILPDSCYFWDELPIASPTAHYLSEHNSIYIHIFYHLIPSYELT